MKNLELSIEKEIEFMNRYQLTADELFLIRLIWYAQDEHPEFLENYFSRNSLGKSVRELLMCLKDKEIIKKTYRIPEKGEEFNPDDVEFNQNATKSFLRHSEELGMDLFNNYPSYTYIDGKYFSLRNPTKLFKTMDEMCFAYGEAIKFNPEKHQEVMELLEYAKENNLINSGICQFIVERQWDMYRQMRDGGEGTFKTSQLV